MRKTLLSFLAVILFFASSTAQSLTGKVTDNKNETLPGAVIVLTNNKALSAISDSEGKYNFDNLKSGNYTLTAQFLGYETFEKEIAIDGSNKELNIILSPSDFLTEEVIVNGQFANANTPVAYTNIDKESIEKTNLGLDVPYLLQLTPSVTVNSDAGAGIGYTSMRIRGTDITRINVTLDGIPLNDAESHGVYWVNLPDYSSSANQIQVQRGVGTSTSGAAAFGANIKFKTNAVEKKPFGEANFTGGSFNTQKATFKAGTGIINKHFFFDARVSTIKSDGYIDRASSDMNSYKISGGYIDKRNLLKVNILNGYEKTYQAWYGVPKDSLTTSTGRTHNPYTYENETDNYGQTHYQLFYTHEFNENANVNLVLFQTNGGGYYEQFKEGRDLIDYGIDTLLTSDLIQRKWLDNVFRGGTLNFNYKLENFNFTAGGGYNHYDGDHFGKVIWMENAGGSQIGHEWYRSNSIKTDANAFTSVYYSPIENLMLWADVQYRAINYDIEGFDEDGREITQNNQYDFINPKAGVSYEVAKNQLAYASFAMANREPKRSDLVDVALEDRPTQETLNDYELGYKMSSAKYSFIANLYYMDYKNQLVQTGQINNVGDAAFVNVAKSYRAGIELAGGVKLFDRLNWNANVTYSQNKIKNYTEYVDNWSNWETGEQDSQELGETDISFSPDVVASNVFDVNVYKGLSFSLTTKYVSEQFIDNTSNSDLSFIADYDTHNKRVLEAYLVNNVKLNYQFKTKLVKNINIFFAVNNVLNEEYETNAWVYRHTYFNEDNNRMEEGIINGYFPQAKMNFLGGINLRF